MKLFYVILLSLLATRALGDTASMLNSDFDDSLSDNSNDYLNGETESEKFNLQNNDSNGEFENLSDKYEHEDSKDSEIHHEDNELRQPFDIDRFLTELNTIDCNKRRRHTHQDENIESEYDPICASILQKVTLEPLGNFDLHADDFYEYLSDNIYRPLAYEVDKKDTLSDLLKDLIFLESDRSLINAESPDMEYNDFQSKILDQFSRIQGMTSDMDKHHEPISNIMVELLKNFHIYWNTLRSKDQIDKVKSDTMQIMRNILKEYEVQEKFLYEVTKIFASRIKEAYSKFIRAHDSIHLLNTEGAKILAQRFIDRYTAVMNLIKSHNLSSITFVKQIAALEDLQEGYYLINYKLKFSEPQNIHHYYNDIYNRIEPLYIEIMQSAADSDDYTKRMLKHFTVTLMLKMKYVEHSVFNYTGISVFVNFKRNLVETSGGVTVKIYYDLLNSLLLVPKICLNLLTLKQCALNEINKVLRQIAINYRLKRRTGGWGLYTYVFDVLRLLFSKSNDMVFSNWTIFKSYYYENLFSTMHNIKERFYIKGIECIDDLEEWIGTDIESFKKKHSTAYINFGLLDELNNYLYKIMLDIKAEFNRFEDIQRDPAILMQIQNKLYQKFQKFENKYRAEINEDFHDLMEILKKTIEEWRAGSIRAPQVSIQVSELPIHAQNLYPQVFHNVIGHDANYDFTSVDGDNPNSDSGVSNHHKKEKKYDFRVNKGDKSVGTGNKRGFMYSNQMTEPSFDLQGIMQDDENDVKKTVEKQYNPFEVGSTENRRLGNSGMFNGNAGGNYNGVEKQLLEMNGQLSDKGEVKSAGELGSGDMGHKGNGVGEEKQIQKL